MDRQQAITETIALIEAGHTVNDATTRIAEKAGVKSDRTVANWCNAAGHNLGEIAHAATKKAHDINRERYAARRHEIRDRLLTTTLDLFDRLPNEPAAADIKHLATAIAIFIDKMRLEEGEATERTERLSIGALEAQLREWEQELRPGR